MVVLFAQRSLLPTKAQRFVILTECCFMGREITTAIWLYNEASNISHTFLPACIKTVGAATPLV